MYLGYAGMLVFAVTFLIAERKHKCPETLRNKFMKWGTISNP